MAFEIILSPDAAQSLTSLRATDRKTVKDAMKEHLKHRPEAVSRSRIKRLHGLDSPQYRLRVRDDLRVYYDVVEDRVEVLAVLSKEQSLQWLEEQEGLK